MTALRHRPTTLSLPGSSKQQSCRIRVRVRIPESLHQQPILSRLVSNYGLTFSLIAARLLPNADGWFDLHLSGTVGQLSAGLAYLDALGVAIASRPNPDGDSWSY